MNLGVTWVEVHIMKFMTYGPEQVHYWLVGIIPKVSHSLLKRIGNQFFCSLYLTAKAHVCIIGVDYCFDGVIEGNYAMK